MTVEERLTILERERAQTKAELRRAKRRVRRLLVAGAAIGVVSVVRVVANRIARHWRFNSHPALFYGLCKVHGLDSAARRLLKRVVRFHRLGQPGRMFVEPKWLDPAALGPSFQTQAAELERLRNRLFNVRPKAAGAN